MLNLNAKERMLLQDEKSHEELCIAKYQDYSNKACDPQLKNLFAQLSQKEQQHLNSINQMLAGTVPNVNASQSCGQQQGSQQQSNQNMQPQAGQNMQQQQNIQNQQCIQQQNSMSNTNAQEIQSNINHDKMLCQDSLSTEKYVSSTYNTAIFEFRDTNARQVLNHIQKEEQEHGEQIYNYMNQHGMYN